MKIYHEIKDFCKELLFNRSLIYELSKRDFQNNYMGSYLGFIWAFLQPLLFIFVLDLVFTLGIRGGGKSDDIPFVVYLICGMLAWLYFSSNLMACTNIIRQYKFLITKINFKLNTLPVIKLFSSLVVHFILLAAALVIAMLNGIHPGIYAIQIIYYLFAMMFLLLGIGWITSSLNVFMKDISNIVSIIVQFGFWLTPIFWNIDRVPEQYQWIIKLNPVFYIVNGYRDSFIYQVPFWERPAETIYFWSFTLIVTAIGILLFRKLRPYFAESI